MRWVTRERPKIDRIACPWLIARFIDKEPDFLYVPSGEVLRVAEQTGAVPYDIPGVEMTHDGELCSFNAFLPEYARFAWCKPCEREIHHWPSQGVAAKAIS